MDFKFNFTLSVQVESVEGERRVGFHEEAEEQTYSDGENDADNDKRPVSKLHRRDTPHHLKNKRVQQNLSDKAANVILNKLKDMPQPAIDEVSPQVEMNPMPPLTQDIGLPIIENYATNGNDSTSHINGEFVCLYKFVNENDTQVPCLFNEQHKSTFKLLSELW